jgi:hypothetical protein
MIYISHLWLVDIYKSMGWKNTCCLTGLARISLWGLPKMGQTDKRCGKTQGSSGYKKIQ